jgi:hypothetical protein
MAGFGLVVADPIMSARAAIATPPKASLKPLVICDLQYESSVSFGRYAQLLGAPVRAIRSDVTRLWREELIPLWRSGTAVQMGMTGYDALFCLSMIAREWGIRPVYRMHHRPQENGTIVHEAIGESIPQSLQRLQSTDWARHNAEVLLNRLRRPFAASSAVACSRAARESTGLCRNSLISWILAPIGSATVTSSQTWVGAS